MEVSLTPEEYRWAAACGAMRRIRALEVGRNHKHGCKLNGIAAVTMDIEGCMAELAAAKSIGVEWPGEHDVPDYPGDLIEGIHVRATKHKTGRLILHESDPDREIFILVCGEYGTYNVAGYTFSDEGKKQQFWDDPVKGRPAYFVPQNKLWPIEELRELCTNS